VDVFHNCLTTQGVLFTPKGQQKALELPVHRRIRSKCHTHGATAAKLRCSLLYGAVTQCSLQRRLIYTARKLFHFPHVFFCSWKRCH